MLLFLACVAQRFYQRDVRRMLDLAAQRRTMVDTQIRTYDVTSSHVLEAIEAVPREAFVRADQRGLSYTDTALTVRGASGESRTLLQPMVFARMLQALDLQPGARALDVAGGSGYGAAVMHSIGATVVALEDAASLTELARATLDAAGMQAVETKTSAFDRFTSQQPFNVIFVHGSCASAPDSLLSQLVDGGRLVAVIGNGRSGRVTLFTRTGNIIGHRTVFDASAAPLGAFAKKVSFAL
jgi:protein-L-isoaspartate(D-aspartate) O-methyltransferase